MREDIFSLLNRHADVPCETFERLVAYHDLLLRWQAKVNLIGPDTVGDVWSRHFIDSIQLLKFLPGKHLSVLDIGSGAGFPGMVLAICGVANVTLAEVDQKKVIFLKEVARVTNTPVVIHAARVEALEEKVFDVVTSRACSALTTLLDYSSRFVSCETFCLFPKGRNYTKEVDDAQTKWNFQLETAPSVTDTQGVILKISQVERRGHEPGKAKEY